MNKVKMACICCIVGILGYRNVTNARDYNVGEEIYENSPANFENSSANFDNSPAKWENSNANFDNSIFNSKRKNVYNEDGEAIGYKVDKKDGGANWFNDSGERIGYEPADEE